MALRKGFGAELAFPHANDIRYDFAGTVVRNSSGVPRAGLFAPAAPLVGQPLLNAQGGLMAVAIYPFSGVAVRDGGVVFLANDGLTVVPIANAPVSNARLDVVYAKQNDNSSYVTTPDVDNNAVFGVLQGVPSATPVRNPAGLPAGALELGTVLVPAGAVVTVSPGVVVSDTFLYTAMSGGVIPFRNGGERALLDAANGQLGVVLSDHSLWMWSTGVGWVAQARALASSTAATPAAMNAIVGAQSGDTCWLAGDGVNFLSASFTYIFGKWQTPNNVLFVNGTTAPAGFVSYLNVGVNTNIVMASGGTGLNLANGAQMAYSITAAKWHYTAGLVPVAVTGAFGTGVIASPSGSVSFAGSPAVGFGSLATDEFNHYRCVIEITTSSAACRPQLQLLDSTNSPVTAGIYGRAFNYNAANVPTSGQQNAQASWLLGPVASTRHRIIVDITRLKQGDAKGISGTVSSGSSASGAVVATIGGDASTSAQCLGLYLTNIEGALMTGTAVFYGYNNGA